MMKKWSMRYGLHGFLLSCACALSACASEVAPTNRTPEIRSFTVSAPRAVMGEPITFSWDVGDDSASFSCTLDVDDDGAAEYRFDACSGPNTLGVQAAGSQQHSYVAEGAHTAVLSVSDEEGASARAEIELTVEVDPDNTAPSIEPIEDQTVLRNTLAPRSFTVGFEIEDPDDDSFTVLVDSDDESVLADTTATCGLGLCSFTLTPSPERSAEVAVGVIISDGRGGETSTGFLLRVVPTLVTAASDDGAGSLRRRLRDAEAGDVVAFDTGGAFQTPRAIFLETQITLDKDVTVEGAGKDPYTVVISGAMAAGPLRLFEVASDVTVVLRDLQLEDGWRVSMGFGQGGAIFNSAGSSLTLIGCLLQGNGAISGGAIYNDGGTVILDDTAIEGRSNSKDLKSNATLGGAVSNERGTLTLMNGSRIVGNKAADLGGGIYNTGTLTIEQSEIADNIANGAGGGVFNRLGEVTILAAEVIGNASEQGGGIWSAGLAMVTDSVVAGNNAGVGGGIYNIEGVLDLVDSEVSSNEAGNGAGIYNRDGHVTIETSVIGDPDLADSEDEANLGFGNGSGIYSQGLPGSAPDSTTLTIDDSRIVGNRTGGEGGGIFTDNSLLHLRSSRVSSNSADQCGGLVSDHDTTTIIENSVIGDPDLSDGVDEGNVGVNYGGGLCRVGLAGDVLTLIDTLVAGNHTDGQGGGLYLEGGTLELLAGSRVIGNSADLGGGIYVEPDDDPTSLTIDDSTVGGSGPLDANSAVLGGGIYHGAGSLIVRGGSRIIGNLAESGGGIYQFGERTITTIRGSAIGGSALGEGNRATLFGGGIYLGGGGGPFRGSMTLVNSSVVGNGGDADGDDNGFGGGIYSASAGLILEGTAVEANAAHNGGGIYNASDSFLSLDAGSSVVGNVATRGVAGESGGGIYNPGTIVTNDGDVSGNDPDDIVSP